MLKILDYDFTVTSSNFLVAREAIHRMPACITCLQCFKFKHDVLTWKKRHLLHLSLEEKPLPGKCERWEGNVRKCHKMLWLTLTSTFMQAPSFPSTTRKFTKKNVSSVRTSVFNMGWMHFGGKYLCKKFEIYVLNLLASWQNVVTFAD